MLGGDLSEKKNLSEKFPIFFALCFSCKSESIHTLFSSNSPDFYENPLPLSRYLVFSPGEKPVFFTLNVAVRFMSRKPNYQMYLKKELLQQGEPGEDVYDNNKFTCQLEVTDSDNFFLKALSKSAELLKQEKLFKTFKFYPLGDFIEYPYK